jgi:uncharacterized DUF497 family protein
MPLALDFEWDAAKAESNLKRHGSSFLEASTVFGDPLSLTEEERGPHREARLYTMGRSTNGRLLLVVHVDRDDRIRLISARVPTRRERKLYDQGT